MNGLRSYQGIRANRAGGVWGIPSGKLDFDERFERTEFGGSGGIPPGKLDFDCMDPRQDAIQYFDRSFYSTSYCSNFNV